MSVAEAVATRRSIRAFQDRPVPLETLRRIMDRARMAPSRCNFQPWESVFPTGQPLAEPQQLLMAGKPDRPEEYDFMAGRQPTSSRPKLFTRSSKVVGTPSPRREFPPCRGPQSGGIGLKRASAIDGQGRIAQPENLA